MLREIRPAITILLMITLITGVVYPFAVLGLGQVLFPSQANGSLIDRNGQIVGSSLIGQNFTKPQYFHPRPSATTQTDPNDSSKTIPAPYNASNSTGSNLGPTAKALIERVKGDIAKLQGENPGTPVPADLVTTSASGLDPDISPQAALFQVPRVAKARNVPEDQVRALVQSHVTGRVLGLLGEPRVNVLALNMALDALH